MNRTDLDARNSAAVRRYARQLADSDGRPPQALLDDLAAVAEEHAAEMNKAANEGIVTAGSGFSTGPEIGRLIDSGGETSAPPVATEGDTGSARAIQSTGGSGAPAGTQRTRTRTGRTPK